MPNIIFVTSKDAACFLGS